MKKILYGLVAFAAFGLFGNYAMHHYHHWQQRMQPININGTLVKKPKNLTNFSLLNQSNESFDDSKLLGKWSIMFFGYTRCPDICPTTLTALSTMYKKLGDLPTRKKPRIIFVSIDPEHDNSQQAAKYSSYFNNNFIGLSGNKAQVANLSKSLGVVAQKVQLAPQGQNANEDNYVIDHSSTLYVINPRGQVQAILTSPHQPDNMAKDFKAILNKFG